MPPLSANARERAKKVGQKARETRKKRGEPARRAAAAVRADSSFSERLRIRVYRERTYYINEEERRYKTGENGLGVHDTTSALKIYLTRIAGRGEGGTERTWRC